MWQHHNFPLWWRFGCLIWRASSSGLCWCSTSSGSSWWPRLRRWFLWGSVDPGRWYWAGPQPHCGFHYKKEQIGTERKGEKKESFLWRPWIILKSSFLVFQWLWIYMGSLRETYRLVRPRTISRFSKGLSELMLSGHVWIHKYPGAKILLLIGKLCLVHFVCNALLRFYAILPVISLTVLNTSSWDGCIFGVLVYVSLQITTYMLSCLRFSLSLAVDIFDTERHESLNSVNVSDLPINRCVDNVNVAIDFRAVFKGVNVGGIDGQSVSQVSGSKSITHCKPLSKQISVQKSNFKNLFVIRFCCQTI